MSSLMRDFGQDARFTVRLVRRAPGFSALVVGILALGIGGNTAVATLLNSLYLRPLPIADADRVLRLLDSTSGADGRQRMSSMHTPNVVELQRQRDLFSGTVAMFAEDLTLTGGDTPERVSVAFRSAGWNETLGVRPVVGRDFTQEEEARGRQSGVALVSDRLWRERFAAPRDFAGVTLHLDGRPYAVVGVMPAGFRFPYESDVWVPTRVDASDVARDYAVFARLRDGVSQVQVSSALAALSVAIRRDRPDLLPGYAIGVRTLRENLLGHESGAAFALASVIGFLLLLACVSVAALLLARAVARRREFVLRMVLGASRWRQLRQMLTEATILSIAGGALGVLIAAWSGRFTALLLPDNYSRQLGVATPEVDARVLAIALAVSIVTGIAVAAAPALRVVRGAAAALRDGGRTVGGGGAAGRALLNRFAVGQMALALVLVAAAGVAVESLRREQHRDLGFDPADLVTMVTTPSVASHPRDDARPRFVRRLVEDVQSIPGVREAAVTSVNPLTGTQWTTSVFLDGHGTDASDAFGANHRLVTPGLFGSMGIPLLRGRDFTWNDDPVHPAVAVISAKAAVRFWPGQDPIGRRLRVARAGTAWVTVVGVAGDVLDARDPEDPEETIYFSYAQNAASRAGDDLHLMIRTDAGVPMPLAAVRRRVAALDPSLAVYDVSLVGRQRDQSLDRDRFAAFATSTFGAFGLLVATLGVYGIVAFGVADRRAEIATRIALGAERSAILRMVLSAGLRLAAMGAGIGLVLSALVTRIVGRFIPSVRGVEPGVLVAAVLTIGAAALLASYLPARQAAAQEPIVALRGN